MSCGPRLRLLKLRHFGDFWRNLLFGKVLHASCARRLCAEVRVPHCVFPVIHGLIALQAQLQSLRFGLVLFLTA